jgi:hypothetical protein
VAGQTDWQCGDIFKSKTSPFSVSEEGNMEIGQPRASGLSQITGSHWDSQAQNYHGNKEKG